MSGKLSHLTGGDLTTDLVVPTNSEKSSEVIVGNFGSEKLNQEKSAALHTFYT
ncbi:MAG TPA: hypothetical protein H9829_12205 [Candidatus Tetragenococcus pullicola]|nr:hypothetical protein [Candidatus Tetragenococcus pullicola]